MEENPVEHNQPALPILKQVGSEDFDDLGMRMGFESLDKFPFTSTCMRLFPNVGDSLIFARVQFFRLRKSPFASWQVFVVETRFSIKTLVC